MADLRQHLARQCELGIAAGEGRAEVACIPRTNPPGATTSAVLMGRPASRSFGARIVNRGSLAQDLADSASNDSRFASSASRDNSVPPGGLEPPPPGLGALPGASTGASMPDFSYILANSGIRPNHLLTPFHSMNHSTKREARTSPGLGIGLPRGGCRSPNTRGARS